MSLFAYQDVSFWLSLIFIVAGLALASIAARGMWTGIMPGFVGNPVRRYEEPRSFWLRVAIYAGAAAIIFAIPILGQLQNAGAGNSAAFFWIFGRVFGVGALIVFVVLRGIRSGTVSTSPGPRVEVSGAVRRLVWVYIMSVVAITFMVPLEYHGNGHPNWVKDRVEAMAVIPALIAWLLILKWPASEDRAFVGGASLAFGLVGAGALALLPYSDRMSGEIREMFETVRFPIQAKVYMAVGLFGLIASFVFGHGQPKKDTIG